MSKEVRIHSAWHYKLEEENYAVVNIYIDENQNTVVCAHSLDTGYYDEWYLHTFYRNFTFMSDESL